MPLDVVIRKHDFLFLAYNLPNGDLTFFSLLVALAYSYQILFLRNCEMSDLIGAFTSY